MISREDARRIVGALYRPGTGRVDPGRSGGTHLYPALPTPADRRGPCQGEDQDGTPHRRRRLPEKGSERVELGRLEVAIEVPGGDLLSGTCERCDDGMPLNELVRDGDETVCQPCAEEAEDRHAEEGS